MAKRIVTKIGNIFCAEIDGKYANIDGKYKVYFQYIANDMSQLNSSVIRVFKRRYPLDANPKMDDIVMNEVAFYAHTVLRAGIDVGAWYKVGKSDNLGLDSLRNVWFGDVTYLGNPNFRVDYSKFNTQDNWWVWHVNEERIYLGQLRNIKKFEESDHPTIEPGAVFSYIGIIEWIEFGYMKTAIGEYDGIKKIPLEDVHSYTKLKAMSSEDVAYFHFVGKKAVAIVIVTPKGKVHLDKNHPTSVEFKMFEGDFGDINWDDDQFITPEEFSEVWGDHKW